jgi:DNA-nicking Smr family endonuclease
MSGAGGGRRGRWLSDEERAIWKSVTRSIAPMKRTLIADDLDLPEAEPVRARSAPRVKAPTSAPKIAKPPAPPKAPPKMPSLAPLDRRTKQRVARGRDEIGARIDLHGMTQARAHAALLRFLARAQADGARIALVITGKGKRIGDDDERVRGVLKQQVPLWLSLPEFRVYVAGFDDASIGHGGQGALYVRVRRPRG